MDREQANPGVRVMSSEPALSTRDRVREWRERDPEATAAEIARGLGVSERRVGQLLRALGLPARTSRSSGARQPQQPHWTFTDRAKARQAARKGGLAKHHRWCNAQPPAAPYQGTILDAMDAAGLTGPSFDRWRTFWRAVFALPMDDADRATLQEFASRSPPSEPVQEAWMVIGRRGGKSLNAALVAVYTACRRDYASLLGPGEQAVIPIISSTQRQTRQVLGFLKGIVRLPTFAPYVTRTLKQSVRFHTNVLVEVQPASYRSTRGDTAPAIICDEVAFWRSDETAQPDKEILDALRPNMATIPGALLLGLSTPYARRGELYKAYGEYYGRDAPDALVWNAASRSMHPTLNPRDIVRAWRDDPAVAASEWGPEAGGQVQFRRDVAAYLDPDVLAAVTMSGRFELPPMPGIIYVAFVDVSGGIKDSFALAIAHREEDRVILDCVREWRAPFNPSVPVKESAALLETYGVTYVTGDRYAGAWPHERYADHGIGYEVSERDKSDLYRDLLPLINTREAELLENQRLTQQLLGLDRRTAQRGRDTIAFMRRHSRSEDGHSSAHDDVANAVAGALVLAAEGLSSEPHNPDDDKPFGPWSPGALRSEYEAGHRVKRHPSQQSKQRNYPTDMS